MKTTLIFLLCFMGVYTTHAQGLADYKRQAKTANSMLLRGDYAGGSRAYKVLLNNYSHLASDVDLYNAACAASGSGDKDQAFRCLDNLVHYNHKDSFGNGTSNDLLGYLYDKDFNNLKTDRRWNEFLAAIKKTRTPVVNVLDSIRLTDQKRRGSDAIGKKYGYQSVELKNFWNEMQKIDSVNLLRVEQIIEQYGWPGPEDVGVRGNGTVFLVIQHADHSTQQKYLPVIREAVKQRKAKRNQLAMLEDRVALAEGRKQMYGTQVGTTGTGKHFVMPLVNPDSVNVWRIRMELPSMNSYLKHWNLTWHPDDYKQQLPEIEKEMELRASRKKN